MSGAFEGHGWTPEQVQEPVERVSRLVFWVPGVPVQQGSKTVFNGRAVDANQKRLRPWRKAVEEAAERMLAGREGILGPVRVRLLFLMPKPATVRRDLPAVRPDLDKLERAVNDALTVAGVFEDDARIVDSTASKRYADDGDEPGVWVTVEAAA